MSWVGTRRGIEAPGGSARPAAPPTSFPRVGSRHAERRSARRDGGGAGAGGRDPASPPPALVLGMGGFVSAPGGVAAWLLRRPLLIHEQNAIPGLANRLLARLATGIMESFSDTFSRPRERVAPDHRKPGADLHLRTSPASAALCGSGCEPARARARREPGAEALNRSVPAAAALIGRPLEIRHQAGEGGQADATRERYRKAGVEAAVTAFVDDVAESTRGPTWRCAGPGRAPSRSSPRPEWGRFSCPIRGRPTTTRPQRAVPGAARCGVRRSGRGGPHRAPCRPARRARRRSCAAARHGRGGLAERATGRNRTGSRMLPRVRASSGVPRTARRGSVTARRHGLDRIRRIHLIGIGGAGMGGIAEVLHTLGFEVSGSDVHANEMTGRLSRLGVRVHAGHHPGHVRDCDVVGSRRPFRPGTPSSRRRANARCRSSASRDAWRDHALPSRHRGSRHARQDHHDQPGDERPQRRGARPDVRHRRPTARVGSERPPRRRSLHRGRGGRERRVLSPTLAGDGGGDPHRPRPHGDVGSGRIEAPRRVRRVPSPSAVLRARGPVRGTTRVSARCCRRYRDRS